MTYNSNGNSYKIQRLCISYLDKAGNSGYFFSKEDINDNRGYIDVLSDLQLENIAIVSKEHSDEEFKYIFNII